MGRTVKSPDVRRAEILDTAQKFFYIKGYEQTSIQDIISEIGIAKGTFYHYFNSKPDLLDAVIERMTGQVLQALAPLVADPRLTALEKLNRLFDQIASWKNQNRKFLLDLLRIWYRDENAILRAKAEAMSMERTAPLLARIIEQGNAEGVFSVEHPADTAEIVLQVGSWLSDTLSRIILHGAQNEAADVLALMQRKIEAHHRTIERILNAPSGSIHLYGLDQIEPWLTG